MLSLVLSVFTDSPIFLIGNDLCPGDKQCCSQSCFIFFFQRHLQIVLRGLKHEFINMYPTLEYKHMNTLQNLLKSRRFLLFLSIHMFTLKISSPVWYLLILNQHMIMVCSCSWSYLTCFSIHG